MSYSIFKRNKKATEKPVEIFIALFVILAVAMVLLKMFGGQISSKQKELKMVAEQNRLTQMRQDIKTFCSAKCAEIDGNIDRVNYCKTKYLGDTDINNNGIGAEYNGEFSIVGICEDTIYCSAVTDCQALSMKNCLDILCSYFKNEWDLTDTEATERLNEFIQAGDCTMSDAEKKSHWYYMLEEEMTCG